MTVISDHFAQGKFTCFYSGSLSHLYRVVVGLIIARFQETMTFCPITTDVTQTINRYARLDGTSSPLFPPFPALFPSFPPFPPPFPAPLYFLRSVWLYQGQFGHRRNGLPNRPGTQTKCRSRQKLLVPTI